ncbi:MAG: hypothetical protein ACRYG8_28320 [Janthinobacterium lividum]
MAYPIIMRVIAVLVQPKRLEMARIAKLLIDSPNIDPINRKIVQVAMEDAFDPKIAILLVFVFPIFVMLRAFKHSSTIVEKVQPCLKEDMEKFSNLHMLSLGAANPIFFVLLIAESMLAGLFVFPISFVTGRLSDSDPITVRNLAVAKSEIVIHRAMLRAELA